MDIDPFDYGFISNSKPKQSATDYTLEILEDMVRGGADWPDKVIISVATTLTSPTTTKVVNL